MRRLINGVTMAVAASVAACATVPSALTPGEARFAWFAYEGRDAVFEGAPEGAFTNPILTGFYPDPSITRAGEDYYLVTSTFTYFPGIPVFHSRDLVTWRQIGNVIDRPGMLDFTGLGISRGVFAPTIEHHDGVFYVANTCVDCGGNFIVTATDPAGPWSDPVWLPEVGGIDPSLFFDDDGTVYLMNNDEPPGGSTYDGHRAIWIRAIDPESFQSVTEPVVIINGGVRPEDKPIWIEGPQIYRLADGYLLSAAEGGTSTQHSQVVLRAPSVLGPWTPFEGNPILTQRHLDPNRPHPVTSTGHADFVQLPNGEWWATFLATRPYADGHYNTGRETFLMPVRWNDGWPVLTEGDEAVPYILARPDLPLQAESGAPMRGNFSIRDEFDGPELARYWMTIRETGASWFDLESAPGALTLRAGSDRLGAYGSPSFIGRRQQHATAQVTTAVQFIPARPGDAAGLVAFQNDEHFYFLAIDAAAADGGEARVRLLRRFGADDPINGVELASVALPSGPDAAGAPVYLRIDAREGLYDFSYATREGAWITLLSGADGTVLSTRTAGGFVGVVFGLYATRGPE